MIDPFKSANLATTPTNLGFVEKGEIFFETIAGMWRVTVDEHGQPFFSELSTSETGEDQ